MKLTKEALICIQDIIGDCENCKYYSDNCDGHCFELDENKVDEIINKLESLLEVFNNGHKDRI